MNREGTKGTEKKLGIRSPILLCLCLWLPLLGCGSKPYSEATIAQAESPPPRPQLIHLPGIGGHMRIDDNLIAGLKQGGLDADMRIYDWTGPDRGIIALGSATRHSDESSKVAEMITAIYRANPRTPIIITSHSAGTGIAIWALEKLPDDVQIDTLLMMQSALSPNYDLSKALRHVRGRAYSFCSIYDPVLGGAGTGLLGTVDRIQTEAAGRVGFARPPRADARAYDKLQQIAYDESWMQLGNPGDHIGPMRRRFAKEMLAPLLETGKLPHLITASTRAATSPSSP